MSTAPNAAQPINRKRWQGVRDFWARVTEGLEIAELWGQFKSEAHASYGLYSKEVDWDEISKAKKRKRYFLAAWALFQAMLMKLSPARRVLLLVAVILVVFQPDMRFGGNEVTLGLGWVGAAMLFVLLALELGDRITMKRDLEIAREIQQWLVPLLEAAPSETAAETMKRVMTDVNQFASFARQHDDITCLVLRVST
jgi:hypothetical protein